MRPSYLLAAALMLATTANSWAQDATDGVPNIPGAPGAGQ